MKGAGSSGWTAVRLTWSSALLCRLLLAGLLAGLVPAVLAQTAASLIAGWTGASCASSGCHELPIVGSTTSNDKTSSIPVQRILDLDMLTPPALTTADTITTQFRALCSRAPHNGSYMCNNYNTAYIDPSPPASPVDPGVIGDIYRYLFAARHTLTTADTGSTPTTVAPYTTTSDVKALAFDGVALNSPTASATVWTVTVYNFRNRVINLTLTSSNAADFPLATNVAGSCNGASTTAGSVPAAAASAAGSCTLKLGYRPTGTSTAARSGTLTVAYAASAPAGQVLPSNPTSRQFTLSGGVLTRTLTVLPSTPATVETAVNVPAVVQIATLGNGGNSNLMLTGLTFSTTAAANPYSVAADAALPSDGCRGNTVIAAGGRCKLFVSFAPTDATITSYPGRVSIAHNGSNSPSNYDFTGTARQPQLTVSPPSIDFGRLAVGSSAERDVTIANGGGAGTQLSFSGATPIGIVGDGSATSVPGAYLIVTNGCAASLAAGSSCIVKLRYTAPTAATTTTRGTARLAVSSNAGSGSSALAGTALPEPTIAVTPAAPGSVPPAYAMQFGATPVSTTNPTTGAVTLANRRDAAISYRVTASGATGDFAVVDSCAPATAGAVSVIPPSGGAPCTLSVRFTPAAVGGAGTRTANLAIAFAGSAADPAPAAQAVRLTGGATTAPVFGIGSSSVTLQSVVGTPTSAGVVISNPGSAPLVLGTLVLGGNFPGDYTLGGNCGAGTSLPARVPPAVAASCTLTIVFTPGQVGLRDATLTVNHNADGGSDRIDLLGSGAASTSPVLDLGGVASLDFGDVPLGATATRSFSVRNGNVNAGATALLLNSLAVGGGSGEYTLAGGGTCTVGSSLAAGQACSVTVTFSPAAAGQRIGSVAIGSNAGNGTVNLAGAGTALAEPVLSGDPRGAFPSTQVGSTSGSTRSVTVTNPRANAIRYVSAFSGTNAADFTVAAESCAGQSVPAGGSCTLTLRFAPAAGAGGSRVATLAFTFSGTGSDPAPAAQSLTVSGVAAVPAPVFSISAGTISLAAVVGGSASEVAVVSNTGSAPLALSALAFGGAFAADYSLAPANSCAVPLSLAPGNACTLAIRFTPAAAGSRDATVTLTHDAAGSPQTVTLRGTATPAPQGRIELSVAQALNFDDTALGSSSAQTITVKNTGNAPLNFASLSIGGAAAAEFERGGSCGVGVALAVDAQCSTVVTFRPTTTLGARVASITFQSDASNGAATIALTGTAVAAPAPRATLSTAALAFGAQTLGGIYPKRSVRLTNTGSADLLNIAVSVTGAGFADASDPRCPATLAAGAGCDIGIAFSPGAAGTSYTGTVSVASNAAGPPPAAALTGSGTSAAVPVLAWASPAPYRLDFGAVSAGSVSPAQTLTVTNQGPGGAVFTLLNAVGADAANFPLSAGSCTVGQPLFEGASCSIDVRFAPGSAGAKNATVQVASTGSAPPMLSLAGTGLAGPNASLSVSAASLSFDATRVGAQSLPVELTLTSDGSGVVRVSALDISGPYAVQPKSCPALPFTLPGGSACTLTVTFQPQAEGAAAGMLRVGSDADPAQRQVALSGNAVPKADLASGGCSVAAGDTLADPTLWALAVLAAIALAYRWQVRRRALRSVASPRSAAPHDPPHRRRRHM